MKAYGWFGLALLSLSAYCLFRRIEPFYSWFYSFAWWSYILLADNLLLLVSHRSLLTTRRRELAVMLPLSVFAWLIFEACNLAIRNWAYSGVPSDLWIRWPGYALAFATVLPGVFITSDLVGYFVFKRRLESFASDCEAAPHPYASSPSRAFTIAGLLLTSAPFFWPRYFFPAVWIGPIFLLDPLVERIGIRSLSISISEGDRQRIWILLAGGFACGLLWEFWNFWAGSRWIYSIPYFGHFKVFEMPALGFLGFPPFAIECWLIYHLFAGMHRRLAGTQSRIVFWAAIGAFSVCMFYCIDRRSVLRLADGFFGGCSLCFLG